MLGRFGRWESSVASGGSNFKRGLCGAPVFRGRSKERAPELYDDERQDPSASASAGLGAFSSPQKMTDAFEQNKKWEP